MTTNIKIVRCYASFEIVANDLSTAFGAEKKKVPFVNAEVSLLPTGVQLKTLTSTHLFTTGSIGLVVDTVEDSSGSYTPADNNQLYDFISQYVG